MLKNWHKHGALSGTHLNIRHECTQGSQLDLGQMAQAQPLHIEHHNVSLDDGVLADHHVVEHAEGLYRIRKVHLRGISVREPVAEHLVALLGLDRQADHVPETGRDALIDR